MTVPIVRIRKKAPKTTTGCRCCRIRRIKCDEAKPNCKKCSSTGRVCEWFDASASTSGTVSSKDGNRRVAFAAPVNRPWYTPLRSLDRLEGLAFTFFKQHTAGQLHGTFQSHLWNTWAMQISHQDTAVSIRSFPGHEFEHSVLDYDRYCMPSSL
jgi:hypothetical protein